MPLHRLTVSAARFLISKLFRLIATNEQAKNGDEPKNLKPQLDGEIGHVALLFIVLAFPADQFALTSSIGDIAFQCFTEATNCSSGKGRLNK